ncbi:MAG: cellulase family glycosylhydrolase [Acidobacteriota bacterium]|nr:cellulase family glycosylhydrolase [Acidobacteriota bacterium]
MSKTRKIPQAFALLLLFCFAAHAAPRWTEKQASDWYATQPYLVGSNYVPASAINELEMWQADTFDAKRIDLELGWAESLGMTTMRVFLHDLAYKQDAQGFKKRLDVFLAICDKHRIKPMLVLFDSVWDPNPMIGKQRAPRPGVHNSGWVQSPGAKALSNPAEYARLEKYVKDVVGSFAKDKRINSWDVWNEPDNRNGNDYAKQDPLNKIELVDKLLPQVFAWARAANATQPLTSGVWKGGYLDSGKLDPTEQIQIEQSDVVTFHSYDPADIFEKAIKFLQKYNRPIICTEYMARPRGSTFVAILPVGKKYNVGMINWGFVQGKSQTNYPWDSWEHPYVEYEPWVWFHDVFRTDGTPYLREETDLIKRITGKTKAQTALAK